MNKRVVFFLTMLSFAPTWSLGETNRSLLQQWKSVDTRIRSLSARETDLINQKLNLELALDETTENIRFLSDMIRGKRDLVLRQIRYLSQDSGGDLLRNLIESKNPGELERNHRIFLIATQLELDLIRQYNRDVIKLEGERQKLSLRISKLNELQRDLKIQSETFYSELKQKEKIIGKIRRRLKSNAKLWVLELKKAKDSGNREKVNLYQSLLNKNFLDRKGQLTPPTDTPIKINFGIVKLNPITPALPFRGLLFDSKPGTPVRAMADGTVAWIGAINGLGPTIILDHGRDLHSVYSRVQLANLKIGDMIEEGALVGKVLRATGQIGNGLYFEVREKAMPSDPSRWIITKSELLSRDYKQWENVQ